MLIAPFAQLWLSLSFAGIFELQLELTIIYLFHCLLSCKVNPLGDDPSPFCVDDLTPGGASA